LVPELMQRFGCSQRNALRVMKMSASTYLYKSVRKDESALKMRIKEITETRVHYGYRRVHVLLRREGHTDNVRRIYRLYREEGLSLRLKRPRRNKAAKLRQPKQLAHAIKWAYERGVGLDFSRPGKPTDNAAVESFNGLAAPGVPERALALVID